MLTMTSYIHDYVVENAKFFNEFDRSSFINNATLALDRSGLNTAISVRGNQYSTILEKTISHINEIEIDSYAISEFVSKILGSGRVESTKLTMNDINSTNEIIMKPQYLTEAVMEYKTVINNIATGKYDAGKVKGICDNIGTYTTILKKRAVVSNIDVNLTPKDMLKYDAPKKVDVTTKYLEDVVIPFLQDVPKKKKALGLDISNVNSNVRNTISALYRLVDDVTTGVNLNKVDDTKKKLMMQYTFNQVRAILEAVSYMTFVAMRKVHQFEDSVVECQNVYNALTLSFNDAMTLIEAGAFDDKVISATDASNIAEKLVDGSNDVFAELAHNIIEYHKGYISTWASDVTDVTGTDSESVISTVLSKTEYRRTVYNDIVKAYIEIGNGLDILAKNCDDYLAIFDQLVKKAGFVLELNDRFHNEIEALYDLSYYGLADIDIGNNGEKTTVYHTILSEINDYPDITSQIAKAARVIMIKTEYVEDLFNAKKNGELAYSETMNELKMFLDTFKDQFRNMNVSIVKGLYMRLKRLAAKADDCLDNVNSTPESDLYTADDFFEEAVLAEVDIADSLNDLVMETLLKEYCAEREFLERGVRLVYEAEGDATPANTPATGSSNVKVQVTDNSGEASSAAKDTANANKTGAAKAISDWFKKISEWFKDMITKFNDVIGRSAAKNTKWLAENKEGLLNRSYSNVEIQILPYDQMPHSNVSADIGKLTANVNAMTAQNMKNIGSYENLRSKLINFGPKFNNNDKDQITIANYYKVGNKPLQTVPYANGVIKTLITDTMIPYCESFYTTYKDEITKQLTAVSNAMETISKTYVTECVNEISNLSIITEAEAAQTQTTNTQNAETSLTTKASWLSKCVQTYSGAVMNSIRDRNNDYFKVLYALAPKKPAQPVQPAPADNTQAQPAENK